MYIGILQLTMAYKALATTSRKEAIAFSGSPTRSETFERPRRCWLYMRGSLCFAESPNQSQLSRTIVRTCKAL